MYIAVTLILFLAAGFACWRGMRWMVSAGKINSRKELPLMPSDLRVLEESAARMMSDLRTLTDECIARIEAACERAETCIGRFDEHNDVIASETRCLNAVDSEKMAINDTISSPFDMQKIITEEAGDAGMTLGELQLLRSLKSVISER